MAEVTRELEVEVEQPWVPEVGERVRIHDGREGEMFEVRDGIWPYLVDIGHGRGNGRHNRYALNELEPIPAPASARPHWLDDEMLAEMRRLRGTSKGSRSTTRTDGYYNLLGALYQGKVDESWVGGNTAFGNCYLTEVGHKALAAIEAELANGWLASSPGSRLTAICSSCRKPAGEHRSKDGRCPDAPMPNSGLRWKASSFSMDEATQGDRESTAPKVMKFDSSQPDGFKDVLSMPPPVLGHFGCDGKWRDAPNPEPPKQGDWVKVVSLDFARRGNIPDHVLGKEGKVMSYHPPSGTFDVRVGKYPHRAIWYFSPECLRRVSLKEGDAVQVVPKGSPWHGMTGKVLSIEPEHRFSVTVDLGPDIPGSMNFTPGQLERIEGPVWYSQVPSKRLDREEGSALERVAAHLEEHGRGPFLNQSEIDSVEKLANAVADDIGIPRAMAMGLSDKARTDGSIAGPRIDDDLRAAYMRDPSKFEEKGGHLVRIAQKPPEPEKPKCGYCKGSGQGALDVCPQCGYDSA